MCDAFVPDLTFVAETPDGKLIPNPNVMLEYGYALHARSYSIMIPVMNTAYGSPETLPFDMRHARFPLQFDLPVTAQNSERRAKRMALSQSFDDILRLMIAQSVRLAQQEASEHAQQASARRFLAPELKRTIDRVLYIHSRAIPNLTVASTGEKTETNDRKEDFIPYRPSLYPNAPQVRDLSADDAAALSAFYDSLHSLADFVNDWWQREGQLTVNIFNMILHNAEMSLKLGLTCVDRFELDVLYPPPNDSVPTITSRIDRSISIAAGATSAHIARFQANAAKLSQPGRREGNTTVF